jgi:molecular chaperone GrpE (heat shock protein)
VTEPQSRRRRDRSGRWFPGIDPTGPSGQNQGAGPDDGDVTGLPGVGSPGGSPTTLPIMPQSDGPRGKAAGTAVEASHPRGLPGRPGSALDNVTPYEPGPFDGYDAGDAPTSGGQDWGAPAQRPVTPPGGERVAGGMQAGLAVGPPTPPGGAIGDLADQLGTFARRLDEVARLRRHDVELVDRLHEENTRLRQGELTEAMAPLLRGLIRLHDQMSSLGADDPQSVAGILRKQLLQVLDITADVRPYIAVPGSQFDPTRHLALRGLGTDDPARDRTIARGVRPGFVRGTSTVLRPAEAEVYRHR